MASLRAEAHGALLDMLNDIIFQAFIIAIITEVPNPNEVIRYDLKRQDDIFVTH